MGGVNCTNGGWFTRRGAGRPVRPPAVCTKRADVAVISGGSWMSGNGNVSTVAVFVASFTVVTPIIPPLLEAGQDVRKRVVVVREAHLEDRLRHPGDRLGGDPRHGCHGGFDTH